METVYWTLSMIVWALIVGVIIYRIRAGHPRKSVVVMGVLFVFV